MHGAFRALYARGLEMGHAQMKKGPENYQLPAWAAVMLFLTVSLYFVASAMVEYTFGRVVPALIMVESPEAISFEPLPTDDLDSTINKNVNPELAAVKPRPITDSFRTTIRHLQSKGGFRARFRGLSAYVVYVAAMHTVTNIVSAFIPFRSISLLLAPLIGSAICAQLSLMWTHIVISDPSPKPWYRRVPSVKTWKKVVVPTLVLTLAEEAAILVPSGLLSVYSFPDPHEVGGISNGVRTTVALKGLSTFILALVLGFALVLPAFVTLTRVQASLLPDSEESVVPFDRSFGGKVEPEIIGGSGVISMLDAWKTFDWSSRLRLVKAYAKVLAIQIALGVLFSIVLIAEVCMVVGKDWEKLIPGDQKGNGLAL